MRIAQVISFFYPEIGGWEDAVLNKSRELKKRGHEVTVFTCNESHDCTKRYPAEETIAGVEVRRFPVLFRAGNFFRYWPSFAKHLGGFDIVHAHNYRHPHPHICAIQKKRHGYKLVLRTGSPFFPRVPLEKICVEAYDRILSRQLVNAADATLACHKTEMQRLAALGFPEGKISTMPYAVSEYFFERGNARKFRNDHGIDGRIVLYLGRLHKWKQPETLIRAAKLAKSNDAKFVIVGGGEQDYAGRLKQIAKTEGLEDRVLIIPEAAGKEEIRNAYAACELFVLPSIYEPFGIVILEAMAQGKAVIATPNDGPKNILGKETGLLFEPGNAKKLAEHIDFLLENKKIAERMGRAGRKEAGKYVLGRFVDRLEGIYENICQG